MTESPSSPAEQPGTVVEQAEPFGALVDPSLKYAAGKPDCTTDANSAE